MAATPERARSRRRLTALPQLVAGGAAALGCGVTGGLLLNATGTADTSTLVDSNIYLFSVSVLLAVGLYGSTHSIDLKALRDDLTGVVAAVTLGVVLKAALITVAVYAVVRGPEAFVLGIAVAQIDPLSVAALGRNGRMSPRAQSLLKAWASFDDPMTVLLTLYLAGLARSSAGEEGTPAVVDAGAAGYLTGLGLNAALLAGVLLLWFAGRRVAARMPEAPAVRRLKHTAAALLVVTMLLLAAAEHLMIAVALAGLAVRTELLGRAADRAVGGAFVIAFAALGLLLAHDVAWWAGFVLGLAAFGAQAVVALAVMPLFLRRLSRTDRVELGLAQQNGITAVLIALTLERDFPGTVATVGPAVVTVNLLHGLSRALREDPPRSWPRRAVQERGDADRRPSPRERLPVGHTAECTADERSIA